MSDDEHDLSPYELLRIERIRRNASRLAELGLDRSIATLTGKKQQAKKGSAQRKRPRPREKRSPTRFSKRLRQQQEEEAHDVVSRGGRLRSRAEFEEAKPNTEDDGGTATRVDYERWPQEPDELDDDEFEVFVSLRRWRLRRKNELEVEPYKICKNRTLCELIRRVRNDPSWGASSSRGGSGDEPRAVDDVAKDLIECWGLGPSKVAADGYGWEMMKVLAQEENARRLRASRRRKG